MLDGVLEITIALRLDLPIEVCTEQGVPLDFKPSLDGIDEPRQLALSFRVHV